ncbi:HU family DNA-binding protein [Vibrio sp. TBV020]|uniref:HU family DNA-binding protein n=1 Tax=Vibrio sp. TBV020 TaxID=3137398 RepID=UPI0038CD3F95
MSKIDKAELVRRVAREQGVQPELVASLMDSTFNEIEKALLDQHYVDLPEFGRFFLQVGQPRKILKKERKRNNAAWESQVCF